MPLSGFGIVHFNSPEDQAMATFLMFGKYSPEALGNMSPERTKAAAKLIKQHGGKVQSMYATLGAHDLVFVVTLPTSEDAIKASVALSRSTGIAFSTAPAVSVEEFDKLMGEA
jgi:uncharacterized protein with GYD domain